MENGDGIKKADDLRGFNVFVRNTLLLAFLLASVALGVYVFKFYGTIGNQENFGQFGDYVGGLVNPILGFTTIFLLIYSIRLQVKELRNTTEELALTREEMQSTTLESAKSAEAAINQLKLSENQVVIGQTIQALDGFIFELNTILNTKHEIESEIRKKAKLRPSDLPNPLSLFDCVSEAANLNKLNVNVENYLNIYRTYLVHDMFIYQLNKLNDILEDVSMCICTLIESNATQQLAQHQLNRVWWVFKGVDLLNLVHSDAVNQSKKKIEGSAKKRCNYYLRFD